MKEGLGDLAGPIGGGQGGFWVGLIAGQPVAHNLFVVCDLRLGIGAFVREEGTIGGRQRGGGDGTEWRNGFWRDRA